MVQQIEIILKPKRRGFHLVTSEISIGALGFFRGRSTQTLHDSINKGVDPYPYILQTL